MNCKMHKPDPYKTAEVFNKYLNKLVNAIPIKSDPRYWAILTRTVASTLTIIEREALKQQKLKLKEVVLDVINNK